MVVFGSGPMIQIACEDSTVPLVRDEQIFTCLAGWAVSLTQRLRARQLHTLIMTANQPLIPRGAAI